MSFYYPKNFHANGWGWHRSANAATAVRGFLSKERGDEGSSEPLIGNGSLYPTLPSEEDSFFTGVKLYPALPAEEYESGAVEEVVEESCAAVNVNLVNPTTEDEMSDAEERERRRLREGNFSPEIVPRRRRLRARRRCPDGHCHARQCRRKECEKARCARRQLKF